MDNMENNNNNGNGLSQKIQTGTIGWMGLLVFILVIGAGLYFGYLHYERVMSNRQLTKVQTDLKQVQEQIQTLEGQHVKAVFVARKGLDELAPKQILWSEAISRLLKITPTEVFYRSYSGTEKGEITLNALAPSFAQTANVLKILADSPYFGRVFSPTVSQGLNAADQTIVSFGVKLLYQEEDNKTNTSGTPVNAEETDKTKVKR